MNSAAQIKSIRTKSYKYIKLMFSWWKASSSQWQEVNFFFLIIYRKLKWMLVIVFFLRYWIIYGILLIRDFLFMSNMLALLHMFYVNLYLGILCVCVCIEWWPDLLSSIFIIYYILFYFISSRLIMYYL